MSSISAWSIQRAPDQTWLQEKPVKKKKPGVGVGGGGRNSERKILNVYIITCIPTNFLNKWMLMIMSFLLLKTLIIFKKYCSSQNFEL